MLAAVLLTIVKPVAPLASIVVALAGLLLL